MWPSEITEAIFGCVKTQLLYALHELRVIQGLIEDGPANIKSIASETKCNQAYLERLINCACVVGILEEYGGLYSVPPHLSPFLDSRSEQHCGGFLRHMSGTTYSQLASLVDVVRSGVGNWDYGHSPFDQLYSTESQTGEFLQAMWSIGIGPARELVRHVDLGTARMLVDIGGGSGSFSVAALDQWEGLRATVFDLPPVGLHLERISREQRLMDRLQFEPGDFWRDEYPEGDVYVFGYILSDWTDLEGVELLRKAVKCIKGCGTVLILEKLFDEDKLKGPVPTSMADISMMVETRGRHRTASEYSCMLKQAGVRDVKVVRSSGDKHMIVGAVE